MGDPRPFALAGHPWVPTAVMLSVWLCLAWTCHALRHDLAAHNKSAPAVLTPAAVCCCMTNTHIHCQTALIREATLMKKFNHPAVLPLYAAFVAGRELWLVTPYMVSSGT